MTEYNNSTVGAACGYSTLSSYNNSGGLAGIPIPDRVKGVSNYYVVPHYGLGYGYNALTHGQNAGSCSGFFNITNAYGRNANNCNTRYVRTLCNGGFVGGCEGTEFGCCPGSNTKAAAGPNGAGCGAPHNLGKDCASKGMVPCNFTENSHSCCPPSKHHRLGKDCASKGMVPCNFTENSHSCCPPSKHHRLGKTCAARNMWAPHLCPKSKRVDGCCPKRLGA